MLGGGEGSKILKDGRTISVHAFEGTDDKRAWCRTDKNPEPIFGKDANLSAGVCIVLRDNKKHQHFEFFNRIYNDEIIQVNFNESDMLTPNPLFFKINKKLGKNKISEQIKLGVFGIESNFVENNSNKVSFNKNDWNDPIILLTNDKSGVSGRTKEYWTNRTNIPKGKEFFDFYKVIMTSAYPKNSLTSGGPTISNVKKRISEIVTILQPNSAFGKSRISLFMSESKLQCENFLKYMKTDFFAGILLQEPNRRITFGSIIPIQDYSENSDIDWSKSTSEIDNQLFKKYNLTDEEIAFIKGESQVV